MALTASVAYNKFRHQVWSFNSEQLKLLLETKHLYQKVSIQPDDLLEKLMPTKGTTLTPLVEKETREFDRLVNSFLGSSLAIGDHVQYDATVQPLPSLVVGNIKLFCKECESREAFRPIDFLEITQSLRLKFEQQVSFGTPIFRLPFANSFQIFVLVFQCQACQGIPQTFLVKREGMDLILEGRSPIEHVEIPYFIPKEERNWFRDAVIGYQTGKILAALFYLRTFIEQFARRRTGTQNDKMTGEAILSAYADLLPTNLRDTMPSLREWYEKLSEGLHGAKEDSDLFEKAVEKIEEHFDIRRVHRLDEKEVVPQVEKGK